MAKEEKVAKHTLDVQPNKANPNGFQPAWMDEYWLFLSKENQKGQAKVLNFLFLSLIYRLGESLLAKLRTIQIF
ncbi:hypothetical protein N483_16665 [Pseudoalteromonas luteoviolacea NCIMB 1944]|uniref:Uncharacterized protein n=1 Tax=Pseudoalteromonas luteoviolacea (strain 2ta16) TaxID=1353533 RepID=V4HLP2_PSEL2|nr:hypothetical protein PL2TA16_05401 [Pseudoalteromonas luteoviolacea 2ta16]KZN40761.1 hypothetical protein N483_16665 [Pseudoalteromonas luteoviolacea NCIMB 1944]